MRNRRRRRRRRAAHRASACCLFPFGLAWFRFFPFIFCVDFLPRSPLALGLGSLIAVTALSGAFVAGLEAGHAYNTWPLMNGQWIPDGLLKHTADDGRQLTPMWRNAFENTTMVQFNHRWEGEKEEAGLIGGGKKLEDVVKEGVEL